ncbi:MAG: hypothetical protein N3D15_08950, partial [Syntrophorhabdaceae bacterium]|nr:hypothetical protein [Syntrophorhabdaceae bacterium]
MPYSIKIMREIEELDPKIKAAFFAVLEEIEKSQRETVKRSDFIELSRIVSELGIKVSELAEAVSYTHL